MKIVTLSILLILNGFVLLAQDTTAKNPQPANLLQKLAPSSLKKTEGAGMLPTNDIVTNISRSPELTSFYKAIVTAGLTQTLTSQGPITVFAPTDQAFDSMSKGKLDSLYRPDHKYDLIALVTYHALPGIVKSNDIAHAINSNKGTATFVTLTGSKLIATLDAQRNIVLTDENGGQSVISRFDLGQSNGLIHITTAVLIPKFKNI